MWEASEQSSNASLVCPAQTLIGSWALMPTLPVASWVTRRKTHVMGPTSCGKCCKQNEGKLWCEGKPGSCPSRLTRRSSRSYRSQHWLPSPGLLAVESYRLFSNIQFLNESPERFMEGLKTNPCVADNSTLSRFHVINNVTSSLHYKLPKSTLLKSSTTVDSATLRGYWEQKWNS